MSLIRDNSSKANLNVRPLIRGVTLLDRYRLETRIGRGAMGVIWRAFDLKADKPIALKALSNQIYQNESAVVHLRRAVEKNAPLSNPHIVGIHEFVTAPQFIGISMELVEGEQASTLRNNKANGVFEASDIREWIEPLCSALQYAHDTGVAVHGDLKPAHLLLCTGQTLKIADFGISAKVDKKGGNDARPNVGTVGYMSPQQAAGEEVTPLDDIYSLGATFYDLLTGSPPFFDDAKQIAAPHEQRAIPLSLGERRAQLSVGEAPIPEVWESMIAACLSFDPGQRPKSAAEFAQALTSAGDAIVEVAAPAQVPESPENLTATPGNESIRLIWSAAAGAEQYTLKQADQPGGPYVAIGQIESVTDCEIEGLTNGHLYYFAVEANSAAGNSQISNEASATPLSESEAPEPPSDVQGEADANCAILHWTAAPNAESYNVARSNSSTGPFEIIETGLENAPFEDRDVKNGEEYFYTIASVNAVSEGEPSEAVGVTPMALPSAPSGLKAEPQSESVALSWERSAEAESYVVSRSRKKSGPFEPVESDVEFGLYLDEGLTNDEDYFYRVAGVNPAGEGESSNAVRVTPVAPQVAEVEETSITEADPAPEPEIVSAPPTTIPAVPSGIITKTVSEIVILT